MEGSGLVDLEGRPADLFASGALATVVVFTRADCPIANRYAPELARLHETLTPRGAAFFLVYPDEREDRASIREHLRAFDIPFTPLRDPGGSFVTRVGATTSPEAAVFDADGRLVYRGRIDDRFPELGISRPPGNRDLEAAIQAALAGDSGPLVVTEAVGCYLEDLHGE